MLIGLTGERGVGKSEVAKYLLNDCGFGVSHAFEVGKRLTLHFYLHELNIPFSIASEMVYGSLKDTPSPYLPYNDTSRRFMEELGFCMGSKLGPEYTIGLEMERLQNSKAPGIIMESVVYESEFFVEKGGFIIRVERSDRDMTIDAPHTSNAQKNVIPHVILDNDSTIEKLHNAIDYIVENIVPFSQSKNVRIKAREC